MHCSALQLLQCLSAAAAAAAAAGGSQLSMPSDKS
jgi:hypothetical protein